jgi:hypothetical protein
MGHFKAALGNGKEISYFNPFFSFDTVSVRPVEVAS